MKPQATQILITAQQATGTIVTISRDGHADKALPQAHDALHHLKPGDKVTITVADDTDWLQREAAREASTVAKAAPAAKGKATDKGQTLQEGLDQVERQQPDVEPSAGTVTADTGAQTTRTAGGTAARASGSATTTTRTTRRGTGTTEA